MIDPANPLENARHEAFAQALALNKSASEAYRLAGYEAKYSHTAGPRLSLNVDIQARVAEIKAETNRGSKLTKDRALELLGIIAEDGTEKAGDRIAAMRTAGAWCGWETGTEAENKQAAATERLTEAVSRIRAMKRQ